MRNEALDIAMGGTTGNPIPFYPVHLYGKDGQPNNQMVAAYTALTGKTVNIADAYSQEGFDFSGTRNFDKKTGYRSKAFLTVPMKNHEGEIIGVLQLINRMEPGTEDIGPFGPSDQRLAESLASQAAIALTNRHLINQLEVLFRVVHRAHQCRDRRKIPVHGRALPARSGTHDDARGGRQRDPRGAAAGFQDDRQGPLRAEDRGPAARLRQGDDSGARRGQGDQARDDLRPDQPRRHALRGAEARPGDRGAQEQDRAAAGRRPGADGADRSGAARRGPQTGGRTRVSAPRDIGGEVMSTEAQERVKQIGTGRSWTDVSGKRTDFLSADEIKNLTIARGTLTQEERQTINHHIVATIKMLEALPWPTHLRNVPEYAGGHHERMDGKGYPRGLTREQMSIQARVMGIADIFEALTAKDRPYKRGKTLSESLKILGNFRQNGHVDPDLFDVFVRKKVYLRYAQQFLDREQIDEVDESKIPGFVP